MHDQSEQIAAVLLTFIVLCTCSVLLRLFVRAKFTKLALDDLLAVLSLVSRDPLNSFQNADVPQLNYFGACGALFYGIEHGGLGKHVADVPRDVIWTGVKVVRSELKTTKTNEDYRHS